MGRNKRINSISKRLIFLVLLSLAATGVLFAVSVIFQKRFMMSWFVFECGIIGGFVSIQQRLKKISDEDLDLLTDSWYAVIIAPIFGGIFALVLYLLFLSKILEGHIFPEFYTPSFGEKPTTVHLRKFFFETYPLTSQDFAKLAVWSFIAGFSERLVPDLIKKVSSGDIGKQE